MVDRMPAALSLSLILAKQIADNKTLKPDIKFSGCNYSAVIM